MAKNEIDFSPANPENAAAGAPEVEVDDTAAEVAIGPEVEEKPDVVTLTPQEFAALKASGDSAKAIQSGIADLASKLGSNQTRPAEPANAPMQTPEEFYAEHADEMFDKEKAPKLMATYTKMLTEREYGPVIAAQATSLIATRKELLEARDPHFKKYKAEVESLIAQQPANVRLQPNIVELAWSQVRNNHQAEIEAETVADQVSKAVEAKLKELGIDPKATGGLSTRPAAHTGGEGRSTPQISTAGSKPKIRYPDAATKAKLEREALKRGVSIEDLARTRGYSQ